MGKYDGVPCLQLCRISDTKEDTGNQDNPIDRFLAHMGFKVAGRLDLDGFKRRNMKLYKELIFSKIKELKVKHVVLRDVSRLGFPNVKQQIRFIAELEDIGVEIWQARDGGRCLNVEDYTFHTLIDEQQKSVAEIADLSYRVQIGRRRAVTEKCCSPGKIPAYGYDMAVYDKHGNLMYIIIFTGWKRCEGEHGNNKPNIALQRLKRYPDGREDHYNDEWVWNAIKGKWQLERDVPFREKFFRKFEIPNADRAPVVILIYRLADGPYWHTPYEISKILNSKGIKPLRAEVWDAQTVESILKNPIYKGHPCDGINSRADKPEFDKSVEYPITEEERKRIQLVSEEQWDRVNEHLSKHTKVDNRIRRPNLGDFWARPFLICSCSRRLYIKNDKAQHKYYHCRKCGLVRVQIIHDLIDNWLDELPSESRQPPHNEVETYVEELFGKLDSWSEVAAKMWRFIMDNVEGSTAEEKQETIRRMCMEIKESIPQQPANTVDELQEILLCIRGLLTSTDFVKSEVTADLQNIESPVLRETIVGIEQKIRNLPEDVRKQAMEKRLHRLRALACRQDGPAPDYHELLYLKVFEQVRQPVQQQIDAIDLELDNLTQTAIECPALRGGIDSRSKELALKKRALESSQVSLVDEYRREKDRYDEFIKLRQDVTDAKGQDKYVKLQQYLDRVIVSFDGNLRRHTKQCKLSRLEIITKNNIPGAVFDLEACRAVVERYHRTHSPEARAKSSAFMKKKWANGEMKSSHSPKQRAKSSTIMKERWASGEMHKVAHSPEARAKLSASMKKRWALRKKEVA